MNKIALKVGGFAKAAEKPGGMTSTYYSRND